MLRKISNNGYIIVPIIIFCIIFWCCAHLIQYYNKMWHDQHLVGLNKIGLMQSLYFERHLKKTLSAAYILGSIVKHQHGRLDQFDTYAEDLYKSIGGISSLELSPNGIIEKIYPLKGHEKAIGHNIIQNDARKKEAKLAIDSKQLTLAGPFQLIEGGIAVVGRYPIFLKTENNSNSFWGFSTVLIYLNELLRTAGIQENNKFEYRLARIHPDTGKTEVIYGHQSLTGLVSSQFKINVPNGEWLLQLRDKTLSSQTPLYYFGIFIALVLALTCSISLFTLMKQPRLLTKLVENKTAQLERMALFDSLTGLANRYEFERQAERLLLSAKHENQEHVLCYMDLDQFKVINDTCGHVAGDELLRQLCQVLKNNVRKSDTLCRMGGDEFGLLIENCALEDAKHIVEFIHVAVQGFRFIWKDKTFQIGISIGMANIDKNVQELTDLISRADAACYKAKGSGRNRIHTFFSDSA